MLLHNYNWKGNGRTHKKEATEDTEINIITVNIIFKHINSQM